MPYSEVFLLIFFSILEIFGQISRL